MMSVSAWEKPLDTISSKTEVSPLNKLVPEPRRGLASAALFIGRNLLVASSSNGSGGMGMVGAFPGC